MNNEMNLNELLCEKQGAENVNENAANGNVNNPNAIEIERAKTNIAEAQHLDICRHDTPHLV